MRRPIQRLAAIAAAFSLFATACSTVTISASKDVKILIRELKKDQKVVSVLKEGNNIIVLITKSEMGDSAYRITPLFEKLKISVVGNYVLFYLKNN